MNIDDKKDIKIRSKFKIGGKIQKYLFGTFYFN